LTMSTKNLHNSLFIRWLYLSFDYSLSQGNFNLIRIALPHNNFPVTLLFVGLNPI